MKTNKIKRIFSIFLIILCIFIISGCKENENSNDTYERDLSVYFINVGQGDCQLCLLPNGQNVLIDAGLDHATCFGDNDFPSWNNIKTILNLAEVIRIDYFIITHYHMDHYKFAEQIIKEYDVKNMVLSGSTSTNYSYKSLIETIEYYKINTIEAEVGMYLVNEPLLKLQVVATQKLNNPSDANICSVCTKLTYDEKSILSMGDAGFVSKDGYPNGEEIAMKSGIDLKSDVLKVGHHGSSKSSGKQFLSKVKPDYAVFTTAKVSTTHHPHSSAIERIKFYTNNLYQTKDDGTILLTSNGQNIKFTTHIGE